MKASSESNLKAVHLELGGKSPFIVMNDANIDLALMFATVLYKNASQNCCCGTRMFIQEGIHDEFLRRFIELTKALKVGDAFEKDVHYGPVINNRQFTSILKYIDQGVNVEKMKLECGGKRIGNKGYYIEPTIFSGVDRCSMLAQEEIFGPVICVMKPFKTLDEALERANDTTYGLACGLFTSDMNTAEYFIRNIESGTVWVNNYYGFSPNVPFGGVKQSGFGKDCGEDGLIEFTTTQAIHFMNDFSKFGTK